MILRKSARAAAVLPLLLAPAVAAAPAHAEEVNACVHMDTTNYNYSGPGGARYYMTSASLSNACVNSAFSALVSYTWIYDGRTENGMACMDRFRYVHSLGARGSLQNYPYIYITMVTPISSSCGPL